MAAPAFRPGQPPLDAYNDSKVHVATASVGVKSGTVLPVGVTASGSYTREDAGQLDQRSRANMAAATWCSRSARRRAAAGVGYEKIEVSQRDALLDGTGKPVIDAQWPLRHRSRPRRAASPMISTACSGMPA
jgi:hypothetical protein